MSKVILDSGILSAYMNRVPAVFDELKERASRGIRIGTCTPILAEISFGIELSASRDRNFEILKRNLTSLSLWPFDKAAALTYGKLAAHLRRSGRPMQTVDMMLAAVALNLGDCVVITTDTDLEAIPELVVERW